MLGGPVGVVTAFATGWPLVLLSAVCVTVGALVGAITTETENPRAAALDAMLPIGAWLVGAAVGWVVLATQSEHLPAVVRGNPSASALAAAFVGGTLAVTVLVLRLRRRPERSS
jgi:hypothetical protein